MLIRRYSTITLSTWHAEVTLDGVKTTPSRRPFDSETAMRMRASVFTAGSNLIGQRSVSDRWLGESWSVEKLTTEWRLIAAIARTESRRAMCGMQSFLMNEESQG